MQLIMPGGSIINPCCDVAGGSDSSEDSPGFKDGESDIAPMRFLFAANTPRDPNLGAAGCDISTIEALRGLGHEVDEIWGTDMPQRIAHRNLHQLLELPRNFANAVADRCASRSYDVIQVNQPHAYLAAKMHRLCRRPGIFINRSHGWEPCSREAVARLRSDARPVWRRLLSRAMAHVIEKHNQSVVRWSDGLVLCSRRDRDYIIEYHAGDAERLLALAPGVPPDFLAPLPPETPDASGPDASGQDASGQGASEQGASGQGTSGQGRWKKLLFIGNFAPYKAPEIAAEVFRDVLRAIPECRATWVCPQKFHAQARRLVGPVAGDAVTFLDWMPRDQLRTLYDQHGLILIPSYFEGFSLTFLEAMTRGLCVLGTMVGGLPQVIRHGTNGFLFRPGTADGIIERALQLMSNPEECRRVGKAAHETAITFTWERTAREYVAFCRKLMHFKKSSELPRT
jgi:glycosyltransferase involved in cell wall biosynthesis